MSLWSRLTIVALVAALVGVLVVPHLDTASAAPVEAQSKELKKKVKGDLKDQRGNKQGTFDGELTITDLKKGPNGKLLASGELRGKAKKQNGSEQDVVQKFTNQEVTIQQQGERCDILTLSIPGGLFIDLLGLHIDIAPILIEIYATTGENQLLGNLLCALLGLLNPQP